MKNIDENLIGKLSGLVKLNLNDQEIKKLSVDLTDILSSFSKLNSIKLDDFNEFDDSLKENNQTSVNKSKQKLGPTRLRNLAERRPSMHIHIWAMIWLLKNKVLQHTCPPRTELSRSGVS